MRKGISWISSGVLLLALVSCGGGGNGNGGGLQGTLNVDSFVIPAGETRTVTGDLIVNSIQDLRIHGELLITPGARVALYSKSTVGIHGPIRAAPGRKRGRGRDDEPKDLIIVGRNVDITLKSAPFAIETADFGDNIHITTTDPQGTVTISQDLITKQGKDSTERGVDGGRAGSINIGDLFAIKAAKDDGKTDATKPKAVVVTSMITTGRGGNGFTDLQGIDVSGVLTVTGSNGGWGGKVHIDATLPTDPKIPTRHVTLGGGGNGGSCGAPGNPVRGRSGQQPGEEGQSVKATAALSGLSGALYIGGNLSSTVTEGTYGSVYISAGNGGAGANGGKTTIEVYDTAEAHPALSQITLADGGNGGAATTQFVNGGKGGAVDIRVLQNHVVLPAYDVRIDNYGNGGGGSSGCAATPTVPGSHGGVGGDLTVPPPHSIGVSNSFRGGRGGDGTPPGVKGLGGTFTRDGTRYPDGASGFVCGTPGVSDIVFDQEEVRLTTNEEKLVTLTRRGPLAQVNRLIQVTIQSEDGSVVRIRNLADNQVSKSVTLPWPVAVPAITFKVVGGVNYHNDPDIVATIVDAEYGNVRNSLEILNSQQLTTRVQLMSITGTVIPAGSILSVVPDGGGRIGSLGIAPPGGGCDQWHGIAGAGGFITVDGEVVNPPEGACGYGPVIQPQHATDRSRAALTK